MDVIPGSYTVHCQGCQEREQMRWPSRDHQRRVGFFLCEEQFDLWRLLLLQEPLSVLLNCRSKAFVLSDKYTGQSSSSERYTHIKKNKQARIGGTWLQRLAHQSAFWSERHRLSLCVSFGFNWPQNEL